MSDISDLKAARTAARKKAHTRYANAIHAARTAYNSAKGAAIAERQKERLIADNKYAAGIAQMQPRTIPASSHHS